MYAELASKRKGRQGRWPSETFLIVSLLVKTYDPSVLGPSKSFGLLHPAGENNITIHFDLADGCLVSEFASASMKWTNETLFATKRNGRNSPIVWLQKKDIKNFTLLEALGAGGVLTTVGNLV